MGAHGNNKSSGVQWPTRDGKARLVFQSNCLFVEQHVLFDQHKIKNMFNPKIDYLPCPFIRLYVTFKVTTPSLLI